MLLRCHHCDEKRAKCCTAQVNENLVLTALLHPSPLAAGCCKTERQEVKLFSSLTLWDLRSRFAPLHITPRCAGRCKAQIKNGVQASLTPFFLCFAESEGFEPPDPLRSTVFKTAAFDHSANSPILSLNLDLQLLFALPFQKGLQRYE